MANCKMKKCNGEIIEETRYNQAYLSGTCDVCHTYHSRAYCARPGYGMPEDGPELPAEEYLWQAVPFTADKSRRW